MMKPQYKTQDDQSENSHKEKVKNPPGIVPDGLHERRMDHEYKRLCSQCIQFTE